MDNRITSTIKRAALYIRVSTEEQAKHGASLEAQRKRLAEYAIQNDLVIVDYYADEGVSANKRYTRRPEFMRMLNDCKSGKVDVILIIKLDRFFRSVKDFYEVQTILDKYKIDWIATEENYDTTTASGRFALNINLAIAQDGSDRTSERIKFTFDRMTKEGRVITGTMPKGYRIENKRPVIDEEEAEMVRDLFNHFIDTRSKNATIRYCLEKYHRYIDAKTMKALLTCTWYIGEAYGNKNYCQRILDDATFYKAQEIIQVRAQRNGHERSDRVYYFTGLVYCAECGGKMTTYYAKRKDDQRYIYYRCPKHTMNRCEMGKQINQNKIEQWLVDNIAEEAKKHNLNVNKKRKTAPTKKIDTAKINAKLEKLKDLYLNDLITKDMYEKDYKQLTALLQDAEQQNAQSNIKAIDISFIDTFNSLYQNMANDEKKAFWSRTINRITINADGDISVTFSS